MGLIGTIQDLLHARLVGQEGAPSPVTGPDDRHEVVAPSPVDSNRPAVDWTDSLPVHPAPGDWFYDSSTGTLYRYENGDWNCNP